MSQELIVHNAVYQPDGKRLTIVIAMVDFTNLETTATVVDKDTGVQLSQTVSSEKRVNQGFGETIFCADAQGHTHDAAACAKAHADYGKVKTLLAGKLSDWKTKTPATNMTPADRKLE